MERAEKEINESPGWRARKEFDCCKPGQEGPRYLFLIQMTFEHPMLDRKTSNEFYYEIERTVFTTI